MRATSVVVAAGWLLANGGAAPTQRDLGVLNIAKPFVVQCPALPPRLASGAR